ncbi:MAG TPA: DNA polymerase I [Thermomicrobiales bacterium]|nr:DNA polymerase I [Thermomicrobiales bacterium]
MPKTRQKTIMLIDGYGLIFRAYHAIDTSMATSSGEQTNAVFGFARMLLDVLRIHKPDYAIVALDSGKTFRHEEYPEYKGTRAEMPQDLRDQISRVREIIDVMNIPTILREGYEADDVIGSLSSKLARTMDVHVLIITGDSDLLQLVEPHVEAVLPGRPRFSDLRVFDEAAVINRYGFTPDRIPDYKALVGDTSDNIPGVPGVGEKTATALITTYGDVDGILDHLDEITPTRARNAVTENVDKLKLSKYLATIVRDLEIEPDLEHSAVNNYDREQVIALFRELEFRSLVNHLPESAVVSEQPVVRETQPDPVRTLVQSDEALASLAERIRATGTYAYDVETTSLNPITANLVGLAIAVSPLESYYIPVQHGDGSVPVSPIRRALQEVLLDPAIQGYAHHAKYDDHVLHQHGIEIGNLAFDTMIAAYLLGEQSVGLKDLAFGKLGIEMTEISELIGTGKSQLMMNMVPLEQVYQYACGDVEATFGLVEYFRPRLTAASQDDLFRTIEMPLIPVLEDMEQAGIAINAGFLEQYASEVRTRMAQLEAEIESLAGHALSVNSPKQLAELLFVELDLPKGRRTKTGFSVDQDHLETLREAHPIIAPILEYKTLGKLLSTYLTALPLEVNPQTGRIHTSYNQTVAATGRLSSNSPNLQNIPIRTEAGRKVREAFVADHTERRLFDDAILVSADYSQIELRLMAHMSGDPFLVEAFNNGLDIHKATAALVYGVDVTEVTSEMRGVAKTVNFGLLYGMQAFGLSRDTGMSRTDAQAFIDLYWSRLPLVRDFFRNTIERAAQVGYVETLYGRRRAVPDLTSSNGQRRGAAERVATNMPLQGTAADIMKIAMINLHKALAETSLPARMLLQVHDELVIETSRANLNEVADLVRGTMQGAAKLSVPLTVDVAWGLNWNDLTEIESS